MVCKLHHTMSGTYTQEKCGEGTECIRRGGIQPPFPLMSKEKTAGGEKETSQGGVASEQTPHPSSCPPLAADRRRPFRCSSFSHTNRFAGFVWEPCPFANPLKTTKKGAAAPLPWIFPVVWFVLKSFLDLQNAIQMRLCQTGVVVEILCGKVGRTEASAPTSLLILETLRIPYVKYSTGANKTTRTAHRALGKPDSKAARRAFGLRTE